MRAFHAEKALALWGVRHSGVLWSALECKA